jgi:hypothetical protein
VVTASGPPPLVRQAASPPDAESAKRPSADPLSTELLFGKLDEMAQGMVGGRFEPEAVAIASGLAVSVGFVVWSQRSLYLLASALAATPLWKQFDLLEILDRADEKAGRAKGQRRKRRGRVRENPLVRELGRGPHRTEATKSSDREIRI